EETVRSLISAADLDRVIETDGALEVEYCSLETATMIGDGIWGQGFPPPRFCDDFEVVAQRVVGEKHLKLTLVRDARRVEAMRFQEATLFPPRIRAVYQPAVNDYNGYTSLQLNIEHWQDLPDSPGKS